jgi:MFS family permease
VEESIVAHITAPQNRGDIYAWYSLVGSAGTAFGTMTCGWAIQTAHSRLGWETVDVYRLAFYAYAGLGFIKAILALMLSSAVEADIKKKTPASSDDASGHEQTPLLQTATTPGKQANKRWWLPNLNPASLNVILSLCVLFAVDSFASGLAPL